MHSERRHAPRQSLELPLRLDDGRVAMSRDISTQGLYVFVEPGLDVPPTLRLRVATPLLAASIVADVIRVEPGPFRTGLALRIRTVLLSPSPQSGPF